MDVCLTNLRDFFVGAKLLTIEECNIAIVRIDWDRRDIKRIITFFKFDKTNALLPVFEVPHWRFIWAK